MVNEVVIEGYIASEAWQIDEDTLFRLVSVRDPNRPAKQTADSRETSDYVTVRLPASKFAGIPLTLAVSRRIRVHGFLQSREYQESLHAFLRHANGLTNQVSVSTDVARQVTHNRGTTEVVVERILDLGDDNKPPARTPSSTARPQAPVAKSCNGHRAPEPEAA